MSITIWLCQSSSKQTLCETRGTSWHVSFIYPSIYRHRKYLSLNPKSKKFKRMHILYIYWKVICMLWLIPVVWLAGPIHMHNVLITSKKKKWDIYQDTNVLSKYTSKTLHLQMYPQESSSKSSLEMSPTCSSAVHFWLKVVGLSSFLPFDLFWLSHTLYK